jgi:hypothetical protein
MKTSSFISFIEDEGLPEDFYKSTKPSRVDLVVAISVMFLEYLGI